MRHASNVIRVEGRGRVAPRWRFLLGRAAVYVGWFDLALWALGGCRVELVSTGGFFRKGYVIHSEPLEVRRESVVS